MGTLAGPVLIVVNHERRGDGQECPSSKRVRMTSLLKITDLHVAVDEKPILKGVSLEIRQG